MRVAAEAVDDALVAVGEVDVPGEGVTRGLRSQGFELAHRVGLSLSGLGVHQRHEGEELLVITERGDQRLREQVIGGRERERIDLILLDLSMPRMSVQEFLNVIRADSPCPRIIVSTGHIQDHGNGKTPDVPA